MAKYTEVKKILVASILSAAVVACGKDGGGIGNNTELPLEEGSPIIAPDPTPVQDSPTIPDVTGFRLDQEVQKYKARYGNVDENTKLVDNTGKGDSELYGTRNVRTVLTGVLYRGGANNRYLNPPRSNVNPLPTVGLNNLCKEDFSAAIYLYSENFSTAPKSVNCKNTSHQDQSLQYKQYAAYGENEKILAMVYDRIKGKLNGPIYAHCWNGWHSSGLISGMALKQFCGWTDAQADAYWVKNTDGNSSGFTTIRNRLKNFKPLVKYSITAEERKWICPQ